MLRLAIAGANGRMGQMLVEAAAQTADVHITSALGRDSDVEAAFKNTDVLIDFTRPEATLNYLAACKKYRVKAVIGTTGFSAEQKLEIEAFAKHIAIVFAPNMSIGVNVSLQLVEAAAKSLGLDYDIEVFEAHHKMKVDAPSGTALALGEAAAGARGQRLSDVAIYERHHVTTQRERGSIGFSVVRAGDIIGDHTVFFAGPGERIEITHKSSSRATYAQGAMRAAKFLADKKTGLFDMRDVLELRSP
jgi:4-hydroxy-tetrahydrodipicolinate reductase